MINNKQLMLNKAPSMEASNSKRSSVDESIQTLGNRLGDLDDMLNKLQDRLITVLRQPEPRAECDADKQMYACLLQEQLCRLDRAARMLSDKIYDITDRLEI